MSARGDACAQDAGSAGRRAIGAAGLLDGFAKRLTVIAPAKSPMTMNSALGLLCLGGAGLLREAARRRAEVTVDGDWLLLAIGVATIAEHAVDRDLAVTICMGAALSAIALTLLGAALLS